MALATIQVGGREGCAPAMIRQCRLGCGRQLPPAGGGVLPHQIYSPSTARLTVWCKSLMFNGRGYTVYDDTDGRMVFRVDNYAQNWREEAHLMDRFGSG